MSVGFGQTDMPFYVRPKVCGARSSDLKPCWYFDRHPDVVNGNRKRTELTEVDDTGTIFSIPAMIPKVFSLYSLLKTT